MTLLAPVIRLGLGVPADGGGYFQLDSSLLDGTDVLAPEAALVDVESVESVETYRGRGKTLDQAQPGTGTIVIQDADGRFDPDNAASPYAGQLVPGRSVQVLVDNLPRWSGYIDDWASDDGRLEFSRVSVTAVDGLSRIATTLDEHTTQGAGDTIGDRIERVLNLNEVAWTGGRDIDDGSTTLPATTFGDDSLGHLAGVELIEQGHLFITGSGVLTFRDRDSAYANPPTVTFTDVEADLAADTDGTHIPYSSPQRSSSSELLYNRITATPAGGAEQVAEDADSIAAYGPRTLSLGELLTDSVGDTTALLDLLLSRYSQPLTRFTSVTVEVEFLTAAQRAQVLQLDIGDRVLLQRTPLASFTTRTYGSGTYGSGTYGGTVPALLERDAVILGLEESGERTRWHIRFELGDTAVTVGALRLDDTRTPLDTGLLGF